MDDDHSDGEGFGPQKYTGIKMEVTDWSPAAKAAFENQVGRCIGSKIKAPFTLKVYVLPMDNVLATK
ncbi:hypothetical protein DXG03_005114, partial [Asterophora parasitica]